MNPGGSGFQPVAWITGAFATDLAGEGVDLISALIVVAGTFTAEVCGARGAVAALAMVWELKPRSRVKAVASSQGFHLGTIRPPSERGQISNNRNIPEPASVVKRFLWYNGIMKKPVKPKKRTIENKQARFNYSAQDSIEVGMILHGDEIKAIRKGLMQLTGSYGRILQGAPAKGKKAAGKPELWLIGAQITGVAEKQRSIKLLAHRNEIDRLIGMVQQKGFTLVPNRVYFSKNRAKLDLSIAKGAREYEKRSKIQKRDVNRDIARSLRSK